MPRVKSFDEEIVLEKAMELFWKQGFHATSVQDLVHHLGINRASLYDTYGDKRRLFLMAFQRYMAKNRSFIQEFFDSQENVRQGLRTLFSRVIEQAKSEQEDKGCFVVNTTTELLPGDKELKALIKANNQQFKQLFEHFLAKGVAAGQIAPSKDLKSIALLLYTLQSGIRVLSKVELNEEEILRAVDAAIALLD